MTQELDELAISLPEKSAQYLDWICGKSLSQSTAIRALLNVAMRLDVDVSDLTTQTELEQRIWEAMARNQYAQSHHHTPEGGLQ